MAFFVPLCTIRPDHPSMCGLIGCVETNHRSLYGLVETIVSSLLRSPGWPYMRERVTRPHLRGCASLYPCGTGILSQKWPKDHSFGVQHTEKRPVPADSGNFHADLYHWIKGFVAMR